MTSDVWKNGDEADFGQLVPLYILLNGRTSPRHADLDLATQVVARQSVDAIEVEPEYMEIIDRCASWMSIAEIGAYLHRPLTITKIMVDVLVEQGLLDVASPAQHTISDRFWLLETVLAGLERL